MKRKTSQPLISDEFRVRLPVYVTSLLARIGWFCIACMLLIFLALDNPQWVNPVGFIMSILNPPSTAPVVLIAKQDIPMFKLITKDDITVKQANNANESSLKQSTLSDNQGEKQERMLLNRMTLQRYAKGDVINAAELGPKVSFSPNVHYEVRVLDATSPIIWMHPGDTIEFSLVESPCTLPNSSNATATPTCTPSTTVPHLMTGVVILKIGDLEKNATIPLLVAIPTETNRNVLSFLGQGDGSIIAYPVGKAIS